MALPATHCDVRGESNRRQTGHDVRELERHWIRIDLSPTMFRGEPPGVDLSARWCPTLISVAKSPATHHQGPGGAWPILWRTLAGFDVL